MPFLNLKSESTLPMLMFFALVGVVVLSKVVFPQDDVAQVYIGVATLVIMMFVIVIYQFTARVIGGSYDHLTFIIRLLTGEAVSKDLYIEVPESLAEIKPLITTSFLGRMKLIGRTWYMYFVRTRAEEIPGYGKVTQHLFFLPCAWNGFFHFLRRIDAAFFNGENYTHGHSDATTAYLFPTYQQILGVFTPMYLFVEGSWTHQLVTESWARDMDALGRVDMQKFITENEKEIWPEKRLTPMIEVAINKKSQQKGASSSQT